MRISITKMDVQFQNRIKITVWTICTFLVINPHQRSLAKKEYLQWYLLLFPSLNHAKIFVAIPDEQSHKKFASWPNHTHSDLHQARLSVSVNKRNLNF